VLVVEQWAELQRLHFTEGVSIRELARRFGLHRKTVRRALESANPPKYTRPPAPSKLDPFKDEVHRLLKDEPRLPAVRIRELLQPLGYAGGETILKEHVREVRPFFLPARTYQRTVYLPGELAQCDLWEPRAELPVGFGQQRRGYVVTRTLGYSASAQGRSSSRRRRRTSSPPCCAAWSGSAACRRSSSGIARARCTPAAVGQRKPSPASAVSSQSAGGSAPHGTPPLIRPIVPSS
jgi:transposase